MHVLLTLTNVHVLHTLLPRMGKHSKKMPFSNSQCLPSMLWPNIKGSSFGTRLMLPIWGRIQGYSGPLGLPFVRKVRNCDHQWCGTICSTSGVCTQSCTPSTWARPAVHLLRHWPDQSLSQCHSHANCERTGRVPSLNMILNLHNPPASYDESECEPFPKDDLRSS